MRGPGAGSAFPGPFLLVVLVGLIPYRVQAPLFGRKICPLVFNKLIDGVPYILLGILEIESEQLGGEATFTRKKIPNFISEGFPLNLKIWVKDVVFFDFHGSLLLEGQGVVNRGLAVGNGLQGVAGRPRHPLDLASGEARLRRSQCRIVSQEPTYL